MKILTGIDLPFAPLSGSFTLCDDLYGNINAQDSVKFLSLHSNAGKKWSKIKEVDLLNIKKEKNTNGYAKYVDKIHSSIEKQINTFKPDIIHIQHFCFGMAAAFSEIDLPKIAFCHGTDVEFAIKNEIHRKTIKKVLESSEKVVFPTKSMFYDYKKLFPNIKINPVIIPWGISDEIFKINRSRTIWHKNKCNLLYAGRLSKNKGVDTIIKSMKFLDKRFVLTIIGDGDQKDALIKLVKEYGLSLRVKFLKFQPRKELWKLFNNYDIMIISTKIIEAFCLTAIEGQAHGLPVIHSDIGGTKDVIGLSALRFRSGNCLDLSEKIKSLAFDFKKMNQYSKIGFKNAKKYKISQTKRKIWDISRK